jgi:hypothetical protein
VKPYDVVIPTAGRATLQRLLEALRADPGPEPRELLVVSDRRRRGPAAARNAGWRACSSQWIVFLDDDVVPEPGWKAALERDLDAAGPQVAAVQARVVVPTPLGRRATDWERNVAGLERARWATADMACRRTALEAVGGFDERFRRAYREDSDLGLRLTAAGFAIASGRRRTLHPVRAAGSWISLRLQAGNADDALMAALHGRDWRARAGAPPGRRPRHLAISAAGLGAAGGLALGRRRTAACALAAWLAGTAELAWARIAPGPRTVREVWLMVWTSALMPAVASGHWILGLVRARRLAREPGPRPATSFATGAEKLLAGPWPQPESGVTEVLL